MSAKLLILLLVFLLVEDPWAKAQDARIKLCGRDFVRNVVQSCGNSRGKRHAPETDGPGWGMYNNVLDRLSRDDFPTSGKEQQMPRVRPGENAALGTPAQDAGSPEGHGSLHNRLRRDMGPAGLCCRSGCTKSELVQFC